jgi:hypothetical protein
MSDDWRLHADLHEKHHAVELRGYLDGEKLEHELDEAFHERVALTYDDAEVFCYAGSQAQAERAAELIRSLAAQNGWQIDTDIKHWHSVAEEWEDPDEALPSSDAERSAEHDELIEREREEEQSSGQPDFEVRVQCRTHHDAVAIAKQLEAEGIPSLRRWRYLLIGATDEDTANALAERIRGEAPEGSEVTALGTLHEVRAVAPANPFAILGGLGG